MQHAAILLQLHQSAGKHLVRNQSPLTAEKKNHGRTPRGKRGRVIAHGTRRGAACRRELAAWTRSSRAVRESRKPDLQLALMELAPCTHFLFHDRVFSGNEIQIRVMMKTDTRPALCVRPAFAWPLPMCIMILHDHEGEDTRLDRPGPYHGAIDRPLRYGL